MSNTDKSQTTRIKKLAGKELATFQRLNPYAAQGGDYGFTQGDMTSKKLGTCCNTSVAPSAPGAPIRVSAGAGDQQAFVSFRAPLNDGGSPIIGYRVTSSPGGFTASAISSPITITGLTNGVTYTFTVVAINGVGESVSSSASNPITPDLPMTIHIVTISVGSVMSLPFRFNPGQSVIVDWGDGSALETSTTAPSHTYASPSNYTILVSGSAYRFGSTSGYTGNNLIISVEKWGPLGLLSLEGCFIDATQLISVPSYIPSSVDILSSMFSGASAFNQDISGWDVSKVTNMGSMFLNASAFNQPIGGWDVSKVTDMGTMFAYASAFNQNIGGWNVSKVKDMGGLFLNASAFNQPIGGWNVSTVTYMISMFSNATSFNQSIGGWNIANVTNTNSMFLDASAFNQDLSTWSFTNVGAGDADCMLTGSGIVANIPYWPTFSTSQTLVC